MPACHAGDRGFKSRPDRHISGSVAQSVEQWPEEPRVGGSIPPGATTIFSINKLSDYSGFFYTPR